MSLQDKLQLSGVVSFTGVTVVFVVLVLLIVIISLFSGIISRLNRKQGNDSAGSDADYTGDEEMDGTYLEPAEMAQEEDDPHNTPAELVAAIMAAITVFMGEGASFRLRSIRRTKTESSAWNVSGRQEYLSTRL